MWYSLHISNFLLITLLFEDLSSSRSPAHVVRKHVSSICHAIVALN